MDFWKNIHLIVEKLFGGMTTGDGDQQRRILNSKRQIHMDRTQTEHDMFGNF